MAQTLMQYKMAQPCQHHLPAARTELIGDQLFLHMGLLVFCCAPHTTKHVLSRMTLSCTRMDGQRHCCLIVHTRNSDLLQPEWLSEPGPLQKLTRARRQTSSTTLIVSSLRAYTNGLKKAMLVCCVLSNRAPHGTNALCITSATPPTGIVLSVNILMQTSSTSFGGVPL